MPLSYKNHAGFSMIEVLISLLILAGGLLALARFQGGVVTNESYNKQRVQASHISQLAMDKIRIRANELVQATPSLTVTELKTNLGSFSNDLTTAMNADLSTDNSIAKTMTPNTEYTVAISYPTAGLNSDITNIAIPVEVKVSWTDYGAGGCGPSNDSNNCSATLKTLISKDSQALF